MAKKCFLALDFDENVSEGIVRSVFEPGYECLRTDRTGELGSFLREVVRGIGTADVVVADITGHNPNVLYELGLAHAFRRETIVLKKVADLEEPDLPADLNQFKVILYQDSLGGAEELRKDLQKTLATLPGNGSRSSYLGPDIDWVDSQMATVDRMEETLTRVFTNASHPLTAVLLEAAGDGRHVARVRAASPDANRFYGYAPRTNALIDSNLEKLLGLLERWMDKEDFVAFRDDQTRIGEAAASGIPSFATVPIRLNRSHPHVELRERAFLPMVLGVTEPVDGRKVTYTIILYLDVGGFLENIKAEYALPADPAQAEPEPSRGLSLWEFLKPRSGRPAVSASRP